MNPTILMALASAHASREAERLGEPLSRYDLQQVELRLYPYQGGGYWMTQGWRCRRWYWVTEDGTCTPKKTDTMPTGDCRVIICGARGEPFGTWPSFDAWESAMEDT